MRRGLVYVLAKLPRPGRVKTRLSPPLTALQACRMAEVFAIDTLTKLAALDGLEVRLALSEPWDPYERPEPGEPCERPRGDGPGQDAESAARGARGLHDLAQGLGLVVEGQGDGDLGTRMARLLDRGLASGLPTILVGTDSPDLPPATVVSAFEALGRADVVIAPARDGGYVLVGARRRVTGLFEIDASWSSPRVFAATCEALRREGCGLEILAPWDDVDDAAALVRLASRLDSRGGAAAPATAGLLETWRRQGVGF